jgi:hypothetical protein
LRLWQYMVVRKHIAFWMDDRPATRRDLVVADGSKKADDCRFDTSNHFDHGGDSWRVVREWGDLGGSLSEAPWDQPKGNQSPCQEKTGAGRYPADWIGHLDFPDGA